MATLQLIAYEGQTLTLYLDGLAGSSGTPDVGGYEVTEVDGGLYEASVSGLTGEFYAWARNDEEELAFAGYYVLADDAGVYRYFDYQVNSAQTSIDEFQSVLEAIKRKTDTIRVGGSAQTAQTAGTDIISYVGETQSVTIATEDYQSKTLIIVWEPFAGVTDVATVVDANITKTDSTIAFALPAAVGESARTLKYSIRDTANGDEVLALGRWRVLEAATVDSP